MRFARRAAALIVAALALAGPSFATTYWVSPTGTSGATGADSTTNAKSLAWVNSNAGPGDVIRFKSGTYTDEINPTHTAMTASRLRFYGFPQDPSAVVVARVRFESVCNGRGRYCTARWITSASSLDIHNCTAGEYPVSDSIVACVAQAGGLEMTGNGCVADSLTLTHTIAGAGTINDIDLGGLVVWGGGGNFACTNYSWGGSGGCSNNVIKNVTLNETLNSSEQVHTVMYAAGVNNQLVNCTFNVTINSTTGYYFGLEQYRQYGLTVSGCTWNIVVNGAIGGTSGVWCQRDSSRYSRFTNNRVTVTGSGVDYLSFLLTNSGTCANTTGWSMYDGNLIRDDIPDPGLGVMCWYNGARSDTLRNNVIRTNAGAPIIYNPPAQMWDGPVLSHNTFYTAGSTAISLNGAATGNNPRIVSGIYYSTGSTSAGNELVKVSGGVRVDSAGVYFARGGNRATAILYNGVDGAPGTGGNFGISGKALWCSPQFTDSSYATFDPRLRAGSCAQGGSLQDGFAGAFGASSPDPCIESDRPGRVTDLIAVPSGAGSYYASIRATLPGEAQFSGAGDNTSIHVHRSPSPIITDAQYDAATDLSDGGHVSDWAPPGTFSELFSDGPSTGTWWYAAKFLNEVSGKWSCLSNTDSATIFAIDTSPPATVSDLLAVGTTRGLATLSWTVPTDDHGATGYDLRFRYDPVTSSTWDDTTRGGTGAQGRTYFARYPVADVPAPATPGTKQSITIALRPSTPIYFAIKTRDAAGNWSAISNTDSVVVPTGSDEFSYPRTYVYGGAGTYTGIPQARPLLLDDSLTVNTPELDKLATHNIITINPNAAPGDSIEAVVRYLRAKNPRIRILVEPVPDVSYYYTPTNTIGTGVKFRREYDYYRRVWNMLIGLTPWPASFTLPYQNAYGVPQGYGGSPDSTTPSALLWSRIPGRKNALWATVQAACPCAATAGVYANAGATLRNVNIAYRDANGRFVVADSLVRIEKELFYDRTYKERDGSTRRLFDGLGRDLHSYFANLNPTGSGFVDSVDWVRAGYASRPEFDAAFTDAAIYFDRAAETQMPAWHYFGGNGYSSAGHDNGVGFLHEYLWTLQGGSWESNIQWAPGGMLYDAYRNPWRPAYNTAFAVPTDAFNDSSMVTNWTPDTSYARREYRWFLGSACLTGAYLNYGTTRAFMGVGQSHAKGAYYGWMFDERFVNRGPGVAMETASTDSAGWLGMPTTDPYQHYPSATGAVFLSNFTNGSSPDSSIWQTLTKGSTGRVTVRPTGPNGLLYHLELTPAAIYGADWQLGAISKGFNVTNQDYTISGWVKADTTRFVHIGLRDSSTAGAWSGAGGTGRAILATPQWTPFAFRVFAGGSSAKVGVYVYAADTIGTVRLAGFQVHPGDSTLWIREFEHGVVVVNPSLSIAKGHTFGHYMRRLTARPGIWQDVNNGSLSRSVSVPLKDAVFLLAATDSIRPAPINDLAAVAACGSVGLSWTAVGSDSLTGTAATCEVRYSTSTITSGNYSAATVGATLSALPAGYAQSAVVQGLAASTTYYFAAKTIDDAGFVSAISNVVSVTTPSSTCGSLAPDKMRPLGGGGRSRVRVR